ncbi:DNA-directed RNA polymerase III subunit RPC10 [Carex littledalei]|uniref:DNA-directed RNA polymerase III subunit RPC10 n=1 Tax=Carex littledalei TaxID=544730 RepID=A0A833VGX0_9POAL|nr:DNA-directed RNA polymerase III subunit RPC10 [Carex littledalei]
MEFCPWCGLMLQIEPARGGPTCPRCHNGEAYFKQMQIRSADEPMTTFYKCCNDKCHYDWRED